MNIARQCRLDDISAYLDGELDGSDRETFERHILVCNSCADELKGQKSFLCELDFALGSEPAPELPENFAAVVAVNAQSDMHGVRSSAERRRAILFIIGLIFTALAATGGTAWQIVVAFLRPVASVTGLAFRTLYDVAAGTAIISRSIGGHVLLDSSVLGFFGLALFIASLALLPRMISRYHRAQS
jgi:anti-sigma factor RsiW